MDISFKDRFVKLWKKYFANAELPIIFYYTNNEPCVDLAPLPQSHQCIICDLLPVRQGDARSFDVDRVSCGGGKRYLGFSQTLRPQFEYFLSCGIQGKMEGERYKKSPELVKEILNHQSPFKAPGEFIIFKRWDALNNDDDQPLSIIFFATPDVLSGLFTLANFDVPGPYGVISPFCSGCSAIVQYPYHESLTQNPRAVLGMFDVSARPCVKADILTFTIPWQKFIKMVDNMEESFLITNSWNNIHKRISR